MRNKGLTAFSHIFYILACAFIILPLIAVVMISLSKEYDVVTYGYKIIPMHFTFAAYKAVFAESAGLVKSVFVTLFSAFTGSTFIVLLSASFSFVLSSPQFTYKKYLVRFFMIPMFFGGGLIPTYILITQYLHLGNNLLVYAFTGIFSFSYVLLLKASFSQVPHALIESAEIDGANQATVFFRIMIPMSSSMIAMVFCMSLLSRWNDFQTSLYYVDSPNLYTIQYLLQITLQTVNETNEANKLVAGYELQPAVTLQYAMAIIAALPVFIAFPFMQKYFSKGITIGSVKG